MKRHHMFNKNIYETLFLISQEINYSNIISKNRNVHQSSIQTTLSYLQEKDILISKKENLKRIYQLTERGHKLLADSESYFLLKKEIDRLKTKWIF